MFSSRFPITLIRPLRLFFILVTIATILLGKGDVDRAFGLTEEEFNNPHTLNAEWNSPVEIHHDQTNTLGWDYYPTFYYYPYIHSIGDFNGDGIEDTMICKTSKQRDGGYGTYSTHYAYLNIYLGRELVEGQELKLTHPVDASIYIGSSKSGLNKCENIKPIGDFNGDGYDDIIVGGSIPIESWYSRFLDSTVFIVFGRDFHEKISLNLPEDADATITGVELIGKVSPAGDFNGDGFDDVLVGSDYDVDYLVLGREVEGTIDLDVESDSDYFFKKRTEKTFSSLGDINGDGKDDIATYEGLFLGRDARENLEEKYIYEEDITFSNIPGLRTIQPAGDFNGDGFDDFVIGRSTKDLGKTDDFDIAFLFLGNSSGFAEELNLDNADIIIENQLARDDNEIAISHADFNGDGLDDLLINNSINSVYLGREVSSLLRLSESDFEIDGGGMVGAGDINVDGYDEIAVTRENDYEDEKSEHTINEIYFVSYNDIVIDSIEPVTFFRPTSKVEVHSNETVSLSVSAYSKSGKTLKYTWSANCVEIIGEGVLNDPNSAETQWTTPLNNSGKDLVCEVQILVEDDESTNKIGNTIEFLLKDKSSSSHELRIDKFEASAFEVESEGTIDLDFAITDTLRHYLDIKLKVECTGGIWNGRLNQDYSGNYLYEPYYADIETQVGSSLIYRNYDSWKAPKNITDENQTCTFSIDLNDWPSDKLVKDSFEVTVKPADHTTWKLFLWNPWALM